MTKLPSITPSDSSWPENIECVSFPQGPHWRGTCENTSVICKSFGIETNLRDRDSFSASPTCDFLSLALSTWTPISRLENVPQLLLSVDIFVFYFCILCRVLDCIWVGNDPLNKLFADDIKKIRKADLKKNFQALCVHKIYQTA